MDARIPQGGPLAVPARTAAAVSGPARRPGAAAPRPDGPQADPAGARLRPDTPRGAAALMAAALGPAVLPAPLDLMAALDEAQRLAPMADRAVPGLGRLVGAIIDDERFKLARTLDLGRQ